MQKKFESIHSLNDLELQEVISLISKNRLESFEKENDKEALIEHCKNIDLARDITPKLAILEIALRNKLDNILSIENTNWILESKDILLNNAIKGIDEKGKKILKQLDLEHFSHHQYLSRLSLGMIIHTIKENKLQNKILDLKEMDFRDYDGTNRNFYYTYNKVDSKGKAIRQRNDFSNISRVDIALSLLQNIRNRAYHWENLLKTTKYNNQIFPRITTREEKTNVGIHPNKLNLFLVDLVKLVSKNLSVLI